MSYAGVIAERGDQAGTTAQHTPAATHGLHSNAGTQFYGQSVGACAHAVATQEREVTWKHIAELSSTSTQTNECNLGSQADNGT